MFVYDTKNKEDPETEDMYDATIHIHISMESRESVQDGAHNNIIA